ncbi:MAG: nitroreductase family deazaflavin-dependent oxidoreductase [Pseudonocardiales bacterium]|nr:nitroreductase family deazaflavin-dependent oxidoreductase [Pseudonocardiales bacterium]
MSEKIDFAALNSSAIAQFRANAGQIDTLLGIPIWYPILLLTSVGAKSGKTRVNPLIYHTDGDRLIVFGSRHGAPTHPDWYYNLVAHPEVTVEVGTEVWAVTAQTAVGPERDRLWADAVAKYPFLAELQAETTRQFPVVILQRHQEGPPSAPN